MEIKGIVYNPLTLSERRKESPTPTNYNPSFQPNNNGLNFSPYTNKAVEEIQEIKKGDVTYQLDLSNNKPIIKILRLFISYIWLIYN